MCCLRDRDLQPLVFRSQINNRPMLTLIYLKPRNRSTLWMVPQQKVECQQGSVTPATSGLGSGKLMTAGAGQHLNLAPPNACSVESQRSTTSNKNQDIIPSWTIKNTPKIMASQQQRSASIPAAREGSTYFEQQRQELIGEIAMVRSISPLSVK